jgi:hypothetical protein
MAVAPDSFLRKRVKTLFIVVAPKIQMLLS